MCPINKALLAVNVLNAEKAGKNIEEEEQQNTPD